MSTGYLLDFSSFCAALAGTYKDPETYHKIKTLLAHHGWQISAGSDGHLQISIDGKPLVSPQEAYLVFEKNKLLHEEIYQRAMDIWR